jgi:long-chain acyl-CoA synthetase
MREFSSPPRVAVADASNLTDPVWDNAERYPDVVQFARPGPRGGWQEVTCARFRDEVAALARGLVAAGIGPGERVGLLSKTRYEWTLIDYAIWSCGAVTVPVYETSSQSQVQWILSDSGAVACFVEGPVHRTLVDGVRVEVPGLGQIWQIEPVDGRGDLDRLVAAAADIPAEEIDRRRAATKADDLATVIYTSGTTGRPKGCMLTHRNIAADIGNALTVLSDILHEGCSTLLFLPLAHSFARLIQAGVVQARVRTMHTPDVKNLAADLASFQPTFVLSVPRAFEKIYNTAKQRAYAGGKGAIFDRAERVAVAYSRARDTPAGPGLALRAQHALFDRLVYGRIRGALGGRCAAALSGGAPLGTRLAHFYRGVGVTILEGYGLTETSPAVSVNTTQHTRIGTVGRPLPGVGVRLADDDELLITGDIVFPGYWNNVDATNEMIDEDGWLHTGDLGRLDPDGYLSIIGRKKEIIVTAGGKNVAPAVLEDRVRAHPLVSQCMVVGDRQPFVAALITLDEEALPQWLAKRGRATDGSADELRDDPDLRAELQTAVDEANAAVSKAEAIKVFRILPGDFTEANGLLTPSLKVKRSVVAKEYANDIAAIYH